jgi:predicted O-linked N-acetylglucosamine transferase (SPINDLY family)
MAGAEASFLEAAGLAPDDLQIRDNLATHQMGLGHYAEAEPTLLRMLELDPGNPYALSMLAHARQHRCIWTGLDDLFAQVGAALAAPPHGDGRYTVNPFPLLAMPCDAQAQLCAAQRWAATQAWSPSSAAMAARCTASKTPLSTLVFTLPSAPTMHLQLEHWERIDRARLETFGYGLRAADPGR